jgi:hypothetical protein
LACLALLKPLGAQKPPAQWHEPNRRKGMDLPNGEWREGHKRPTLFFR